MKSSLLAERLEDIPTLGLKSRKPPWKTGKDLISARFEADKWWSDEWIPNKNLVSNSNQGVVGMELPRHE